MKYELHVYPTDRSAEYRRQFRDLRHMKQIARLEPGMKAKLYVHERMTWRRRKQLTLTGANSMKRYDWKPVIASLLSRVQDAGFVLKSIDEINIPDDANQQAARLIAVDAVAAVDEAYVSIQHKDDGRRKALFIILGNGPEEILSDYTVDATLDEVSEAFYDHWEGRNVPFAKAS